MTVGARCLRPLATGAVLACSLASAAFGWGANGHRIVARIGEDHLSETALREIRRIAGRRSLAQIATWPDFIRSETSWNCAQPWHFLTVEDWESLDEAVRQQAEFRRCTLPPAVELPQNVVQAIDFFSELLAGDAAKRAAFVKLAEANGADLYAGSVELSALSFLVHLVGDVHQPLHVGRGGDLGGNLVWVNWFGELSNLHSSWDSGLIESEDLSYTEFAEFLEAEAPGSAELGGETLDWAAESRSARARVYEIYGKIDSDNHLPDLSYQYAHDQMPLLEQRLYRGGRRLAVRLNAIFATP